MDIRVSFGELGAGELGAGQLDAGELGTEELGRWVNWWAVDCGAGMLVSRELGGLGAGELGRR